MEVHKRVGHENGEQEEVHYICDGCGCEIDKSHMRNSAENREKRQINLYDNFGNVRHYCRECSENIFRFCDMAPKYMKRALDILELGQKGAKNV